MPEIPPGIKRPKFRLREDLGGSLPRMKAGKKIERWMKRGDAFRITGASPQPDRHEYYIYCMAVYKHNAVFSFFWDGYYRELNIGSPREARWINSRFG